MIATPQKPSGLLPVTSSTSKGKPFRLLTYFTSASLLVILFAYLAAGYAGGWLIYGAFLENEKEESENIADAFSDLASASGYPHELWATTPFSPALNRRLEIAMDDFGVVQFTLFSLDEKALKNLSSQAGKQAESNFDREAYKIALNGGKTIRWHSRTWAPFLPFVQSQGVTETYSPIRSAPNGPVVAVARVNRNLAPVLEMVRSALLYFMAAVGAFFAAIFFSLWLLVRKADHIIVKQRETLEEQDRRKDEFLAVCSHDVRSPLTSVMAGTKVLLSERKAPLTPLQREILEENQKSLKTVLDLVNTLLDMARLEASAEELHEEEVDLKQTIQDATMLLRGLMEAHKAEINLHMPETPVVVKGDRLKIIRMVCNIASNAIKHSNGKPVLIKLEQKDNTVEISIADRGPGISREHLDQIFDKFSALARKKKTRDEGTGLGLSIVERLVKLHGGSVRVESELGAGTTFHLNLPCTR
jgi:signal transduction histidine kinase